MRILHALLAFYPCQNWGGPPQNALALCKELQKRGHEVSVLTTNILNHQQRMSKSTFTSEWEGIPVTYLNAHWRGRKRDSVGFIWSTDIAMLRRQYVKADIIHIHGYRDFMFFSAAFLGRLYNVSYVVQPRGTLPAQLGRSRLKKIVDATLGKYFLRLSTAGLALSNDEAKRLACTGLASHRIHTLYNPFDPALCPDIPSPEIFRQRFDIPPETKIILFIARLHIKKGLDLLIRAIDGLQTPSDFKLFVVGPDDGYETRARELVNTLGLQDRTIFVGPLYHREKFEAYSAADVFVLPTVGIEGLPTTIIESCYIGTPIVVTKQTEIAYLIDGKIGIAVDNDVAQLRQALETILGDEELRKKYKQNSLSFLREHFDLETIVDRLEELYTASRFHK